MKIEMTDTLVLDDGAGMRLTTDGYLTASPRIARTGVQLYRGSELGRKDLAVVRVYRPEDSVFNKDAMASLAHRPMTDDHPPVAVNAKNWKDYAIGQSGAEVARDGEFIRVPMVLMDAKAIRKVQDGKAELSVGYSCDIEWTSGTAPDGQAYDAIQQNIRGNHIAVVDAARGGDKLRIGDGAGAAIDMTAVADAIASITKGEVNDTDDLNSGTSLSLKKDGVKEYPFSQNGTVHVVALRNAKASAAIAGDSAVVQACDSLLQLIADQTVPPKETKMTDKTLKLLTIDGISVEMTDTAQQVVERHIKTLNDSTAAVKKQLDDLQAKYNTDTATLQTQVATLTTDKATLEAKTATLETQVKDAALTPEKLDALVKDRAVVADKAKAILGDKAVVDGKTDLEIKKQVVEAKLGDACKGWNDAQYAASFDTLTAGVTVSAVADTARAFSAPVVNANDTQALYDKRDKALEDAWKGTPARA